MLGVANKQQRDQRQQDQNRIDGEISLVRPRLKRIFHPAADCVPAPLDRGMPPQMRQYCGSLFSILDD